jgi:hypothetical protein
LYITHRLAEHAWISGYSRQYIPQAHEILDVQYYIATTTTASKCHHNAQPGIYSTGAEKRDNKQQ